MLLRVLRGLGVAVLGSVVAACSAYLPAPAPAAPEPPQEVQLCKPAAADDALVGNWLNKRKESGVMGELRTLFTLKADGHMLYTEQIKRPRQPSQGLSESGCWWREADKLVLKTLNSNGVEVDEGDPIYLNDYSIERNSADTLRLRGTDGMIYDTERTSPGYRLPF